MNAIISIGVAVVVLTMITLRALAKQAKEEQLAAARINEIHKLNLKLGPMK